MLVKVRNMRGRSGREVANQFVITAPEGVYFQSYSSVIAFVSREGKTVLDRGKWDYSKTTGKYRNYFLGESKEETQHKIDSGEYALEDLNGE
jgi:hypothetical protein